MEVCSWGPLALLCGPVLTGRQTLKAQGGKYTWACWCKLDTSVLTSEGRAENNVSSVKSVRPWGGGSGGWRGDLSPFLVDRGFSFVGVAYVLPGEEVEGWVI